MRLQYTAPSLTPIETRYNGYRFRSRLEARFAVFFDALGVAWAYEHEGYDLGAAGWYLPDFWLPNHGAWLEVKGAAPTTAERQRCAVLAYQSQVPVWLVHGLPADATARHLRYELTDTPRWYAEVVAHFPPNAACVPWKEPYPQHVQVPEDEEDPWIATVDIDILLDAQYTPVTPITLVDEQGATAAPTALTWEGLRVWEVQSGLLEVVYMGDWSPAYALLRSTAAQVDAAIVCARAARFERGHA